MVSISLKKHLLNGTAFTVPNAANIRSGIIKHRIPKWALINFSYFYAIFLSCSSCYLLYSCFVFLCILPRSFSKIPFFVKQSSVFYRDLLFQLGCCISALQTKINTITLQSRDENGPLISNIVQHSRLYMSC